MSADRSRESSLDPSAAAVRWFEVDSAWTEVSVSGTLRNQHCTVNVCRWDHQDKYWVPTLVQMELWDPALGPKVAIGKKLRGVYMAENRRWEALPRMTRFARAVLAAPMCGSAPSISGFRELPDGDVEDAPENLFNDFKHAGETGDEIRLFYDEARSSGSLPEPGWVVDDVEKKEQNVVTFIDWFLCCHKQRKGFFEFCEPETTCEDDH